MLSLSELTYNLGHVLQQQGNLAAAAAAYQQAVEQSPAFVKARHALAIVWGEQGNYQAAVNQYRQVLAQQPDLARVHNNLACVLVLQGRQAQALRAYRQAIHLELGWAVPHENLGKVLESTDPVAAATAYRQAIALEPNLTSARYGLGRLLLQQGQIAAAIQCLNQLLRLDTDHSSGHSALGSAHLTLGQVEQALQHFRQALLPAQAQISAFCDWVAQLQATDELTLARQTCGRFLQLLLQDEVQSRDSELQVSAQLAQTYLRLGDLLMRYGGEGQIQQAETYYQQALRLQPQVESYLKLGDCLVRQNRLNAALMLYRLALTLYQDARLYRSLGEILERQQHWSEAIVCYQQALQQAEFSLSAEPVSKPLTSENVVLVKAAISTQRWCQQQSSCYTPIDANAVPTLVSQPLSLAAEFIPESLSNSACASCAGLNCQPCLQKLTGRFERQHLGWGVYQVEAKQLVEPPAYFVAEIPQGKAWMTPYQTPWMVANSTGVLTADAMLHDLCREYPGQLPDCPHQPQPQRLPQTDAIPIAGTVAVLTGLSGHNYFHWMVDILPRLELLRRSKRLSQIDWFWINSPEAEFQQTTLRQLGIPPDKILAADRYPFIQADCLIAPAFPGHLGWVEPWALAFLRQQFLPLVSPKLPCCERIYISRRNAHHRRLLNEAAVLERLEPLGFRAVELETLTLAEQITLFARAKIIIAPHGGGLTNTIFCAPRTTVVELMAPSYIRQYYWTISHHLGLNHYFVTGVAPTCAPIHQLMYPSALVEDIWIDLNALENALKQIGLASV